MIHFPNDCVIGEQTPFFLFGHNQAVSASFWRVVIIKRLVWLAAVQRPEIWQLPLITSLLLPPTAVKAHHNLSAVLQMLSNAVQLHNLSVNDCCPAPQIAACHSAAYCY